MITRETAPGKVPQRGRMMIEGHHTLEDVRDLVRVSAEMSRMAKAGYVEVPSRLEALQALESSSVMGATASKAA